MSILTINSLGKSYGDHWAVRDFSLEMAEGEFVALLGPSGCGKTTTLRCVAGLERPSSGEILLNGRVVASASHHVWVPPERRGLSMVFQSYALWPHMTVHENVSFGLKAQRVPKAEIGQRVEKSLRRVRLWERASTRISTLSGGMQQRVALARALALNSNLILFDEPLSNLDANLRQDLRLEILELQKEVGFGALYVTHDQDEAFSLAKQVVVMDGGGIAQVGNPREVYGCPANAFVAEFTGSSNKFAGKLAADPSGDRSLAVLESDLGPRIVVANRHNVPPGSRAVAYVRSGAFHCSDDLGRSRAYNSWNCELITESFHGEFIEMRLRFGAGVLLIRNLEPKLSGAKQVNVWLEPHDIHCYKELPSGE